MRPSIFFPSSFGAVAWGVCLEKLGLHLEPTPCFPQAAQTLLLVGKVAALPRAPASLLSSSLPCWGLPCDTLASFPSPALPFPPSRSEPRSEDRWTPLVPISSLASVS